MKLFAALVVLVSLPALSYQLKTDSTGSVVQWKSEVHFVAQPGFDAAVGAQGGLSALKSAAATWSEQDGLPAVTLDEGVSQGIGFKLEGGNQNDVVVLGEWPFDEKAIASTIVTIDRNKHLIIDADIAFNRQNNQFGVLPPGSMRGGVLDDVQNTMTHELGHALGLAHDTVLHDAVMYPEAFSGEVNKRTLSSDDRAGLTALYGAALTKVSEPQAPQGCAVVGMGPVLGGLLSLLRARRLNKSMLAVGLTLSVVAIAAPGGKTETVSARQYPVVTDTVSRVERGLFVTKVTLSNGEQHTVYGGRIGDYEQIVDGVPVPNVGDAIH